METNPNTVSILVPIILSIIALALAGLSPWLESRKGNTNGITLVGLVCLSVGMSLFLSVWVAYLLVQLS